MTTWVSNLTVFQAHLLPKISKLPIWHSFSLGVEVAITELDVRVGLPDDAAKEAEQASDHANAVKACKDTGKCVGITVWDFYDLLSWVPGVFSR